MRSFVIITFSAVICAAPAAAQIAAPPTPVTQQPPAPAPAPATPQDPAVQAPSTRVLSADAGLIFFPVKPEREGDFEKIVAKLQTALTTSPDAVRRQQAQGWKVFRAVEPGPNNTTLYVFVLDPVVKDSDYAFWKAMYESFPAEVQELYRLYTAASGGGQTLLNLRLVADFKTPG